MNETDLPLGTLIRQFVEAIVDERLKAYEKKLEQSFRIFKDDMDQASAQFWRRSLEALKGKINE